MTKKRTTPAKFYAVGMLVKQLGEVHLTSSIGVVGVLPVFDDKKKAEEYTDGKFQVVAFVPSR